MAVEQTRIFELSPYLGTLDASEVMITVDHASFPLPMRTSLASILSGEAGVSGATHIEKDTLTNLSSRTLTVTFDTAFTDTPVGWIKVYRMEATGEGGYREYEVLWDYATAVKVTTTGFSILINSSESLTNIVVEYQFV